jgi:hypothetical protein
MPAKLYRTFFKHPDGSWTCIAPARLNHPKGRIEVTQGTTFAPGTMFMGVDICAWLDEDARRAEKDVAMPSDHRLPSP